MMQLELDSLQQQFAAELPPFEETGLLPPGDYHPPSGAFEKAFVRSEERRQIHERWRRHRHALLEDGLPPETLQLVDGSFTTAKPAPSDIDLAVEVPMTSRQLVEAAEETPVLRWLRGSATRGLHGCDAYPIPRLPEEDPFYEEVTVRAIRYWTKWFAKTRDGRVKGRVWVRTGFR